MKKKVLITIGLVAIIAASLSIGAYAAVKYSLIINGKTVKADIKVINGTPYIPLPALSGNLKGITVKHDPKKGTIKIDEPKPPAATKPTSPGLSRSNPAAIGTTVTFATKDFSDDYQATYKVEQVIRGEEAWNMIKEANQFNNEPTTGHEYMLVKLTVGVTKNAQADASVRVSGGLFTLVSSLNKDYPLFSVVEPDPSLDGNLYVGGSSTGWASFLVKTDDANPLLTFGRKYDGTGGVWLKTSN